MKTPWMSSLLAAVMLMAAVAPACANPAACLPGMSHYRYVGDMASDPQCTDNDIQSAINSAPCPNTNIVITGEHTYTAQHLEIAGKSLTLTGTALGCGPPGVCDGTCPTPTAPVITISGSGHSGDSVLYIHGTSNVTLKYLTIRDGYNFVGNTVTYGGGIRFDGSGSLTLDTTTIRDNQATHGAGIAFSGSGGFAGLAMLGHTLVLNNSAAQSGGGIRIDGDSYLSMLHDDTTVALNHAPNGYGGGIHVVAPAHADVASPGYGGLGVIYANDARYGGGVAITTPGDSSANFNLFTIDALRPVKVHDNFASSSGGAFYLKPKVGVSNVYLCARDFRIDGNAAPEGSGIHADNDLGIISFDVGSSVFLNTLDCVPELAKRCAVGVACNTVDGNRAEDAAATPTLGATIKVEGESTLLASRLTLRANKGGYAIRVFGRDYGAQALSNCLLADNDVSRQLIRTESGATEVKGCTITHNTILSTDTIHAEGPLTVQNSIVDQPGNLVLAYSGNSGDLLVQYVLANETATVFGEGVKAGAPTFVDAAIGDYHLQVNSKGVDYAPHVADNPVDLDGSVRERDLSGVVNQYGTLDLGAYERQFACGGNDSLFCSGFEIE